MSQGRIIKVLVTDDSNTVRKWVLSVLTREHGFEVVGEARDGEEGVRMARSLRPDIVVMDVDMPKMDGLRATEAILRELPIPILIFTSTTVFRNRQVPFRALAAGALDVMVKPRALSDSPNDPVAEALRKRLRVLSNVVVVRRTGALASAPTVVGGVAPAIGDVPRVVAIGGSTGGPTVLLRLLREISPAAPFTTLVVQHMAPDFMDGFVEWLTDSLMVPVRCAVHGESPVPGTVLVAPGDQHMRLTANGTISLDRSAPLHECRPAVDALFESVAEVAGPSALGILLTGMGRDGAKGLMRIREKGGRTVVQDEASCVVFGMPKAAIDLGAAQHVLSVEAMAGMLGRYRRQAA